MSDDPPLIPPPPVVRDRLSRHIREGRLLRALYRLSLRASEERRRKAALPEMPNVSEGVER
ncbi:MAG: hypothetical protein JWN86_449 [Planctomycetota bacterium]|nr:hypothetical protein [Planctomycetota bacterium]